MKSEVFTGSSYSFDTPTLERLLQETFPPHMCIYLDGPLEPLATFAHLSLRPEQSEREGGRGRGGEGGREGGREEGEGGRKGGRGMTEPKSVY